MLPLVVSTQLSNTLFQWQILIGNWVGCNLHSHLHNRSAMRMIPNSEFTFGDFVRKKDIDRGNGH